MCDDGWAVNRAIKLLQASVPIWYYVGQKENYKVRGIYLRILGSLFYTVQKFFENQGFSHNWIFLTEEF